MGEVFDLRAWMLQRLLALHEELHINMEMMMEADWEPNQEEMLMLQRYMLAMEDVTGVSFDPPDA